MKAIYTFHGHLWVPPTHNGRVLIDPVEIPAITLEEPGIYSHTPPWGRWNARVQPILKDAYNRSVEAYLDFLGPRGSRTARAGYRTYYGHLFTPGAVSKEIRVTRVTR